MQHIWIGKKSTFRHISYTRYKSDNQFILTF